MSSGNRTARPDWATAWSVPPRQCGLAQVGDCADKAGRQHSCLDSVLQHPMVPVGRTDDAKAEEWLDGQD